MRGAQRDKQIKMLQSVNCACWAINMWEFTPLGCSEKLGRFDAPREQMMQLSCALCAVTPVRIPLFRGIFCVNARRAISFVRINAIKWLTRASRFYCAYTWKPFCCVARTSIRDKIKCMRDVYKKPWPIARFLRGDIISQLNCSFSFIPLGRAVLWEDPNFKQILPIKLPRCIFF